MNGLAEQYGDRMDFEVVKTTDPGAAEQIERHGFEGPPSTIYLGGGTPSRMPLGVLDELLSSLPRAAGAEVTLEANPEDLNVEVLKGFHAAGVNRVSLGVQTLSLIHI